MKPSVHGKSVANSRWSPTAQVANGRFDCTMESKIEFYSRSYAEDVTSVTSGASQGPHSFNLVFVCLFVCVFVSRLELSRICPVSVPYLSRICPVSVPYLSRICDYKGSTGLYIPAGHTICWLSYLSRTVP